MVPNIYTLWDPLSPLFEGSEGPKKGLFMPFLEVLRTPKWGNLDPLGTPPDPLLGGIEGMEGYEDLYAHGDAMCTGPLRGPLPGGMYIGTYTSI